MANFELGIPLSKMELEFIRGKGNRSVATKARLDSQTSPLEGRELVVWIEPGTWMWRRLLTEGPSGVQCPACTPGGRFAPCALLVP
jgi:hypothetical protein